MASPHVNSANQTQSQDEQHLLLLVIFHYVLAGLIALFSCTPIIHLVIGILMLMNPDMFDGPEGTQSPEGVGQLFGVLFTVIPAFIILCGWTLALMVFFGGRCISRRRSHMFCLFVAGFLCLWIPLGTLLGVFTFVVLLRPSVKELFEFYKTPQPDFK